MFDSPWIRKPDFSGIKKMDYDDYWRFRGFKIESELKPREKIICGFIPENARVIDVGCGNSKLPLVLKLRGTPVEVADISQLVLDEYNKHGVSGHLIDLEKPENIMLEKKYDYMILSDVLEHTRNPEEILIKLKDFTDYFVITIPNSAAYQFRIGLIFRGRFFTQWVHHPSEHLRFWSHIDFLDWLYALGLNTVDVAVADGFTLYGLIPWLPKYWKNFLGFRMVYVCKCT